VAFEDGWANEVEGESRVATTRRRRRGSEAPPREIALKAVPTTSTE
jgi:hypothetical protein